MGVRKIKKYKKYDKMLQKHYFFVTFNKFCNKYVIIKKKIYI